MFSFNIAENMPETSDAVPLIAIYLMAIMAISGLSVCFSVGVLNMRHAADSKYKSVLILPFFFQMVFLESQLFLILLLLKFWPKFLVETKK